MTDEQRAIRKEAVALRLRQLAEVLRRRRAELRAQTRAEAA